MKYNKFTIRLVILNFSDRTLAKINLQVKVYIMKNFDAFLLTVRRNTKRYIIFLNQD